MLINVVNQYLCWVGQMIIIATDMSYKDFAILFVVTVNDTKISGQHKLYLCLSFYSIFEINATVLVSANEHKICSQIFGINIDRIKWD